MVSTAPPATHPAVGAELPDVPDIGIEGAFTTAFAGTAPPAGARKGAPAGWSPHDRSE